MSITWLPQRAIRRVEDYRLLAYIFENIEVVPDDDSYARWQAEVGGDGIACLMATPAASPLQHIQRDLLGATDFFIEYQDHQKEMRHLAQAIAPVLEQILAVVVRRIRAQKVQAVAGVIGASPGVPGLNLQLSISAQCRLQTPREFGDIVRHTNPDGTATPATAIRRRSLARGQRGGRAAVRPRR